MGGQRIKVFHLLPFYDLRNFEKITFFGPGIEKCKNIITSSNATLFDGIETSAKGVAVLAAELYKNKIFADTAYFEPFYLKDFIAIKSTKKLF